MRNSRFNDGEDTVVGISIFAIAKQRHWPRMTWAEPSPSSYLAEWAPNPPTGVAGKLAIAALAEVNMGENLVGEMTGG